MCKSLSYKVLMSTTICQLLALLTTKQIIVQLSQSYDQFWNFKRLQHVPFVMIDCDPHVCQDTWIIFNIKLLKTLCAGKTFLIRSFNNTIKNFQIGLFSTTFIINWKSLHRGNYIKFTHVFNSWILPISYFCKIFQ